MQNQSASYCLSHTWQLQSIIQDFNHNNNAIPSLYPDAQTCSYKLDKNITRLSYCLRGFLGADSSFTLFFNYTIFALLPLETWSCIFYLLDGNKWLSQNETHLSAQFEARNILLLLCLLPRIFRLVSPAESKLVFPAKSKFVFRQ